MRMRRRGSSLFGGLIFALVGCILGSVFIALSADDVQDYVNSAGWESAQGEVISSRIDISSGEDGDTYRPYVTYFYFAGDHRYTNDRLNFGDDIYSSGRGSVEEKIAEYPAGRAITVLYNPDDPQDAVIERRLGGALIAFAIAGIVALIFGVGAGIFTLVRFVLWL